MQVLQRRMSIFVAQPNPMGPFLSAAVLVVIYLELSLKVIILSGRRNPELEALSDVYICTPAGSFADRVQELHIKVLHILIELIERHFFPENYQRSA